jgi:hypothetical protein
MYIQLGFTLFMIVAYNIINKVQNELISPSGKRFNYPYLQAAISSLGHMIGFPQYYFFHARNLKNQD